jgi:hypothetical protein
MTRPLESIGLLLILAFTRTTRCESQTLERAIGALEMSPTFPKDLSGDDWRAIAAVRAQPASAVSELVQRLADPSKFSPAAFDLVGFLAGSDQEKVIAETIRQIPIGAIHPAMEPFLTRLIAFDKRAYLERIATEIRRDPLRWSHLALRLAETGKPNGLALLDQLQAEGVGEWSTWPEFQQSLRRARWEGPIIQLLAPDKQFGSRAEVIVGVRIRNQSAHDAKLELPLSFLSEFPEFVRVTSANGHPLSRIVGQVSAAPDSRTTLRPGDTITLYFSVGERIAWPAEPEAVEELHVSAVPGPEIGQALVPDELVIIVAPGTQRYRWTTPLTEVDWVKAEVAARDGPSLRREAVLRAAASAGDVNAAWELILSTDDAWAVVRTVDGLEAPRLRPMALIQLARSSDLSVRRAAIRALSKTSLDPATTNEMREVLRDERDSETIKMLQALLKK